MIRLRKHAWHRTFIVLTALVSMLLVTSSCGAKPQATPTPTSPARIHHGNVVIFTPADGLALTRHKPLSTWDQLVPELVKSLKSKGFTDNAIVTKTSSSLEDQSQDVQDYVVNLLTPLHLPQKTITGNTKKTSSSKQKIDATNTTATNTTIKKRLQATTLIIAPWANKNGNNNYGDYVSSPTANTAQQVADTTNSTQSQNSQSQDNQRMLRAEQRLASALRLAQKAGIHVVMLSHYIRGSQPDVLFHLSDASSIGETQAATLVQKLALDRATRENPRYIEVLLPCHNQRGISTHPNNMSENNDQAPLDADNMSDTTGSDTANLKDDFAQQAFAGIWKVLRPYFASGVLRSTSGKLHAHSTEKDWVNVAFDADAADAVKTELKNRITRNTHLLTPSPLHVDGIIALDDQIAWQTAQTLQDFGYEGSAADINPSFTLPDVIGSFIGKRNLIKRPVPAPRSTQDHMAKDVQEQQQPKEYDAAQAKKWPAITGYGAYKNIMPNIVNGKQWMTTIEHRAQIVHDIVATCDSLNRTGKLAPKITTTSTTLAAGISVPTVREQLLAVSATNLKARLIDPGYISLADAGL